MFLWAGKKSCSANSAATLGDGGGGGSLCQGVVAQKGAMMSGCGVTFEHNEDPQCVCVCVCVSELVVVPFLPGLPVEPV